MKKITFFITSFLLLFGFTLTAQTPGNDSCSGTPEILTIGEPGVCNNILVDPTNATDSGFADAGCTSGGNIDLWYTLTMPDADGVRVKTSRNVASVDTKMSVYKGNSCGSLSLIECNDDIADGVNFFSRIDIIEPENTIIYIRVWDLEASGNTFNICAQKIAYASNDDCENATNLPTNVTCASITGSNEGTNSTNNNDFGTCAGSYAGSDVWFSLTVPPTGRFSIETSIDDGSITDTAMAIYSGSCPNGLTLIACSDDEGTGSFSFIELSNQTSAVTLYIRVWSYANEEKGTFNICAVELPSLSTEENELSTNFLIYPNPANNIVNLKLQQSISQDILVHIFDIQGKIVLNSKKTINGYNTQLNISNLVTGMYFIKVSDGQNEFTKRLIVK